MVQFNPIYESSLARMATWRCEGHSRIPCEPVPSREHTFAIVTGGLFRRHLGPAEVLAAPGDALFFPRLGAKEVGQGPERVPDESPLRRGRPRDRRARGSGKPRGDPRPGGAREEKS